MALSAEMVSLGTNSPPPPSPLLSPPLELSVPSARLLPGEVVGVSDAGCSGVVELPLFVELGVSAGVLPNAVSNRTAATIRLMGVSIGIASDSETEVSARLVAVIPVA